MPVPGEAEDGYNDRKFEELFAEVFRERGMNGELKVDFYALPAWLLNMETIVWEDS
jgi:hypothetical protein